MYQDILTKYASAIASETLTLCRISSPTGYTAAMTAYIEDKLAGMGYSPVRMVKGGLTCDLDGEGNLGGEGNLSGGNDRCGGSDTLVISAHIDEIGAMVDAVLPNGRLRLALIGGVLLTSLDGENCAVHTRDGRSYEGTLQLDEPSTHANGEARTRPREPRTMEVVLDERVSTKEDARALGIQSGDYITFDPRARETASGFIKSRFLDDKAPVAILLTLARWLKDENRVPKRHTVLHFPDWEEIGLGGASGLPAGTREFLAVDVGIIGRELEGNVFSATVVAKDAQYPYHYETVSALIEAARRSGAPYVVDVFPERYGSDAGAAVRAGYDVRTGLVGPGVEATHGYERTHREALAATVAVLAEYVSGSH